MGIEKAHFLVLEPEKRLKHPHKYENNKDEFRACLLSNIRNKVRINILETNPTSMSLGLVLIVLKSFEVKTLTMVSSCESKLDGVLYF